MPSHFYLISGLQKALQHLNKIFEPPPCTNDEWCYNWSYDTIKPTFQNGCFARCNTKHRMVTEFFTVEGNFKNVYNNDCTAGVITVKMFGSGVPRVENLTLKNLEMVDLH
jgi:hypothetical protein